MDHFFGLFGVVPWRCESCEQRFLARPFPIRYLAYAHCGICGNLDLQKISPEHVPGMAATVLRVFHLPALRCEPCRNKFFSLRPPLEEQPVENLVSSE